MPAFPQNIPYKPGDVLFTEQNPERRFCQEVLYPFGEYRLSQRPTEIPRWTPNPRPISVQVAWRSRNVGVNTNLWTEKPVVVCTSYVLRAYETASTVQAADSGTPPPTMTRCSNVTAASPPPSPSFVPGRNSTVGMDPEKVFRTDFERLQKSQRKD